MNRQRPWLRMVCLVTLALAGCFAVAGVAPAQEADGDQEAVQASESAGGSAEESESKGAAGPVWVVPYAVIILSIAGAMFVVCNSARRRDRDKPESFKSTLRAEVEKQ